MFNQKLQNRGANYFYLIGLVLLFSACRSKDLVPVRVLSPAKQLKAVFEVELARSPAERAQGLMYRQHMAQDRGMLFIFSENGASPFWMKNTLIPLDIIFVDAHKKIVNIVAMATPQTETPRMPTGNYRYVLEINGGLAEKAGIKPGDRLEFEIE